MELGFGRWVNQELRIRVEEYLDLRLAADLRSAARLELCQRLELLSPSLIKGGSGGKRGSF